MFVVEGESIFWTDVELDVINRAFWNGSNQQTIVGNDLESPAGKPRPLSCSSSFIYFSLSTSIRTTLIYLISNSSHTTFPSVPLRV